MSSNRVRNQQRRLRHQRQLQYYHARRRVQFKHDSRGITETEGDSICSEGEGLCSEVPESGTRGQQPQHENRSD